MKTIEIYMVQGYYGIIMLEESGIEWTNQVGGTCCWHPKAEGVFIPLGYEPDPDPLLDTWFDDDYSLYSLTVEEYINKTGQDNMFRILTPEEYNSLPDSARGFGEAWIPVVVQEFDNPYSYPQFKTFSNRIGIITYENSD